MSNKQYISRIQNKHDIEANWIKAVNFIPLKGEIIIYDVDENHSYPRVKIGDEVNTITNLPFLSNEEKINELIIEHIQAIDVSGLDLDPDETINIIKQTDGALSVTKQAIKIAASQVADFDAAVGELIPDKPGISASATDDDVVILTLNANYDASTDKYLITADSKHLEAFGNTYNSANATTSIEAGESKTIKIPQLSVDKYGHTVAATDESVTITIPSIPSSVSSAVQSVSASGDGVITLNAEKTGTNVAITGAHSKEGVAYTDNNTATSISGYGATATIKIPQIQSDAYGHVVSHSEDEVTITMPSAQTIPNLTDGGVSSTGNTISLSHEDSFTVLTDVDVNGHTVTPRSTIYTLPKVAVTNETASDASGTSFTYTESVQEKNGDISTTRKKLTTKTAYSTTNPLATIQDIVDKFSTIDGAMEFKGVKSEIPTDNSSFNKGDVIMVGKIEYVYDGTNWVIIGNEDIDTEYIQELINQGLLTLNSTDSSQDGYYVSGVSLVNGGVQISETALPNHFSTIKVGDKTLSPDSLSDTLTLTQGNNITLVGDEANDKITISAKDTTYTAGSGLKLTGTEFNHDNTVTAKTSYPNSSTSLKPSHGGTFKVRDVKYDTEGHITSSQDVTVTLPSETTLTDGGLSPTGNTVNLDYGDSITVVTDVDVSGHTVTPKTTVYTIPSSDNVNTAHTHSGGAGLVRNGDGGISGDVSYKVALKSETKNSSAAGNGKLYPIELDSKGVLAVNVPWTDNNTTYTAGSGLSLNGTEFNHSNTVSAKSNYDGASSNTSLSHGGTFIVDQVQYDTEGHITGSQTKTYKLPSENYAFKTVSAKNSAGTAIGNVVADSVTDTLTFKEGSNVTLSANADTDTITISAADTTYTAGSGLKLTGTEFNHNNSITARTAYSNTSGDKSPGYSGSFYVADFKYDTEGHVTGVQTNKITMPAAQTIPTLVDGGVSPTGTTTNLEHEDTFTVLTDVDVDGHTVTPRSTKFKLPKPTMDIYYIEGSGSSTGKWKGSHERITQYTPGLTIAYKLDAAGSSSAVTLDINGLGAKTVYRNASTNISTAYPIGSVALFIYTEDNGVGVWKAADYDANTTYTNVKLGHGYATSSTAADTTAKTASLSSYLLTTGGIVAVKFTEGNTATSMTLNVNSKGAKTVYLNGSSTIPNNIIAAGDIVTFIYSSQYHIISIQKDSQTIGLTGAVTGEYTGSLDANTISIATSIANGTSTIDNDKKLEYVESIGSTGAVRKYVPTKSAVTDTNPLMTQTDVTSAVNTGISDLATIMRFRGIVTDNPETDADKVLTLKAGGTLTPVTGDVVIYETNRNEWIYDGSKWVELGDERIDEDKIQSIVNDAIGTLDKADTAVDGQYVSAVSETNGIISVTHTDFPIAGAGTTGVVKGFHRTSGTATGTKTTNATNAPAVNARSTTSGRYYGVETDATGAMYVNVPWANGDTKVKQNPKTTDGEFPILVRGTSPGTNATTAEATFRVLTTLNPSNGVITTNNGSTSTAAFGPEGISLTDSTGTITIGSHDNQLLVSGGIDLNITRIQPIIENEASKGLKVDGSKILTHATGAGNNKKPVYVADAYGTLAECAYTLGAACAKGVTDSSTASAISSTGTNLVTERDVYHGLPKINGVHTYDSSKNIYAPTTVGTSGQILKSNGSGAPVWIDGANLIAPKKITLVATAGQTSFSIPFEYDSLSSNLTVYFNGILMKETDNYTVNTTNNTVNLAGFSAEAGDVVTIMGLLGAQSIDFGQELIDVINEINEVVEQAKQEIDNKVNNAFTQIDVKIDEVEAFVEQLPDDVSKLMSKNTNNTLDSGYKITLTNVTPSAAGDVTTKQYVDNAISTATSAIISDVFVASPNSPDKGYSGTEATKRRKLLWIDTGTSDPGLKYYNGSSWVTVPVRWS